MSDGGWNVVPTTVRKKPVVGEKIEGGKSIPEEGGRKEGRWGDVGSAMEAGWRTAGRRREQAGGRKNKGVTEKIGGLYGTTRGGEMRLVVLEEIR